MNNTDIFEARRRNMINELRRNPLGFSDLTLRAMMAVPRHLFCVQLYQELAYQDRTVPISAGQTLSQPSTVARQLSLAEIAPGDKVLEIGTGSGYQTAILFAAGTRVYSIERQMLLAQRTETLLRSLGVDAQLVVGDGYEGIQSEAPFDKIIVTAAAFSYPTKLMQQLRVGGIMIVPIEDSRQCRYHKIVRINDKDFDDETLEECSFVPMLTGTSNRD